MATTRVGLRYHGVANGAGSVGAAWASASAQATAAIQRIGIDHYIDYDSGESPERVIEIRGQCARAFQAVAVKISFGPFILDHGTRQLLQGSREIHLAPKAFEMLALLIGDRPNVISKADLQQRLWPDTFVAEANLSNLVAEIRAALGDEARTPHFIRTAHGYGYAFCGEATALAAAEETSTTGPMCWLEWGARRFPLGCGTHVVGREPDVEVRLDASTVSRRHARFVVTTETTTLEDLQSKNGTFRGGQRVTSPVALEDGDTIGIGSLLVTFHVRTSMGSTETLSSTR